MDSAQQEEQAQDLPQEEPVKVEVEKKKRRKKGKPLSQYAALTTVELKKRLGDMAIDGISRMNKPGLVALYEHELAKLKRKQQRKDSKEKKVQEMREKFVEGSDAPLEVSSQ